MKRSCSCALLAALVTGCAYSVEVVPRAAPGASALAAQGPVTIEVPPLVGAALFAQPVNTRRKVATRVLVARGLATTIAVVYDDRLAVSLDDGARWNERPLPTGFSVDTAVVNQRGAVLWFDGALRAIDYGATHPRELHGRCERGRIGLWGAMLAIVCRGPTSDEASFERSDDEGRTWRRVTAPEYSQHTDGIEFDSRGNLQHTWSWSAGCGGGSGGRSLLARGETAWRALPTPLAWDYTHVGVDGWGYNAEGRGERVVIVARDHGDDREVALVPGRTQRWSDFDGTLTALLIDTVVVWLEGPRVVRVTRVPDAITRFVMDDRGRLLASTEHGVVRWSESRGWNTLDDAIALR
ncbi:MAG: hypothetical protein JNK05_08055 [Myxococcales bacterium]|nr:hypothetical protein [Myxococcales bacterium]